eukprot:scaffold201342_cov26-Tisochrysis_lutea.AAC.3
MLGRRRTRRCLSRHVLGWAGFARHVHRGAQLGLGHCWCGVGWERGRVRVDGQLGVLGGTLDHRKDLRIRKAKLDTRRHVAAPRFLVIGGIQQHLEKFRLGQLLVVASIRFLLQLVALELAITDLAITVHRLTECNLLPGSTQNAVLHRCAAHEAEDADWLRLAKPVRS